jgi:hypothetical protein
VHETSVLVLRQRSTRPLCLSEQDRVRSPNDKYILKTNALTGLTIIQGGPMCDETKGRDDRRECGEG